ncbi:HDOD domain-containing protein [Alteromonas antoniana]|uniref:HDOD domain-containing protein n=1 Tax=Alteromonas antoniana TaxID=2803813 RepID=UPI001C4791E3|nr:HDOD domain-containing protein [Alteromonas antoniana]
MLAVGTPEISSLEEQLTAVRELACAAEFDDNLPNACLKVASQAMQLCRAETDLVLAFLRLPEDKLENSSPLSRHLLMTIVLGFDQHLNEHTLQHIVAAIVLAVVTGNRSANVNQRDMRRLVQRLRKRGLSIWLDMLVLRKALSEHKLLPLLRRPTLNRFQRLVLIAGTLSQLLPLQPLTLILRKLSAVLPPWSHHELTALLRIPGECGPGQRVMSQGVPAVILAVRGQHAAVIKTGGQASEQSEHEWVDVQRLTPSARPPLSLSTWFAYYERCQPDKDATNEAGPFRQVYPINRPPGRLLQIIDALQAQDTDIDALCALIHKEPVFSHFLRQSASSDNRLQLPVHNLKQAVLTYGTERVGDMLTQHALQARLHQHSYPLAAQVRHFSVVVSAVAAQLSVHAECRFTSQSAALVATLLTAPLSMLPEMKIIGELPVDHEKYHDIQALITIKGTENWQPLVSDLAQGWHQPATWRALLYHTGKLPADVPRSLQKEYSLLCLAVYWSASWLFGGTGDTGSRPEKISQAMMMTGLNAPQITAIRAEIAPLLYCPTTF